MTDAPEARPTPPLATGPRGMALLSFEPVPLTGADAVVPPVAYALVALWHGERLLMVHERGRGCWELPGGGIEPGESPHEAAVRELWEEAGQTADELRLVGFSSTAIGPEQRVLTGALFAGTTAQPLPFTPNEEISAIHWRTGEEPLPGGGQVQTVDTYLATLCRWA